MIQLVIVWSVPMLFAATFGYSSGVTYYFFVPSMCLFFQVHGSKDIHTYLPVGMANT